MQAVGDFQKNRKYFYIFHCHIFYLYVKSMFAVNLTVGLPASSQKVCAATFFRWRITTKNPSHKLILLLLRGYILHKLDRI